MRIPRLCALLLGLVLISLAPTTGVADSHETEAVASKSEAEDGEVEAGAPAEAPEAEGGAAGGEEAPAAPNGDQADEPADAEPTEDADTAKGSGEPEDADTAKGSDEPEDSDTAKAEPEDADAAAPKEAPPAPGVWTNRVAALEAEIQAGSAARRDADALYDELTVSLRDVRSGLSSSLLSPDAEADAHHAALVDAYTARVQLQAWLTPARHSRVIGSDLEGVRELLREVSYIVLHVTYQTRAIPAAIAGTFEALAQTPLSVLWNLLRFLAILLVFRWWRRWAASGLKTARQKILAVRPRRRGQLRAAKFLWYLGRVRSPLELLALFGALLSLVDRPDLQEITVPLWTIIQWVLMARFAVLLIDAGAVGGASSASKEAAGLRMRSLRLVAAWLVLLGLGLDISEHYAGRGTLYAWTWRVFELLAAPLLFWLLWSWKAEIFRRLENESQLTQRGRRLLQHKTGVRGFVNAALGAGFLFGLGVWQRVLQMVSSFDFGRSLIAMAFRREVERENRGQGTTDLVPLEPDVRSRLIWGDGGRVENVATKELDRLVELVEAGLGGMAAIVAERGGGKSHLIGRLAAKLGGQVAIVSCPTGGFNDLCGALVRSLELRSDLPIGDALDEKLQGSDIRAIAIDDLHHLATPVMGGLAEMEKLSQMIQNIEATPLIVMSVDSASWQWLSRARSDRLNLQDVLTLPAWSEDQIGELVGIRTAEADLTPDFRRLAIPGQLVDAGHETREERNRFGVFRVLWDGSEGNPAVAMHLWADALGVTENGRAVVQLPKLPDASELDGLNLTVLLTLRLLVRSELARADDIVDSLQVSPAQVVDALRFALQKGFIEVDGGRHTISWDWFRAITRKLTRQNLHGR